MRRECWEEEAEACVRCIQLQAVIIHYVLFNKPAVHMNFNHLFLKPQINQERGISHRPPTLVPILKIQLPYFITYDKPLKALINHDCIIISALTSSLIYSTAVNFI